MLKAKSMCIRNLIMVFSFSIISVLTIVSSEADSEDKISKAQMYLSKGDCDAAWKILWPSAKEKNNEALTWLALSISTGSLLPPSTGNFEKKMDIQELQVVFHTLWLTAWRYHPSLNATYASMLLRRMENSVGARRVAECISSVSPKYECVKKAENFGLMIPFGEYVKRVNSSKGRARCGAPRSRY